MLEAGASSMVGGAMVGDAVVDGGGNGDEGRGVNDLIRVVVKVSEAKT